jgi:predicted transcriptional regulator
MLSGADSDGVPRRARGALESAVMDLLWHAGRPLSPGEVRDLLARSGGDASADTSASAAPSHVRDLSYSTVVTILTRLHAKKMLVRTRVGRSFQYAPLADEAGLAARRLSALLDGSADREAVLSRFVADLPDSDEELLRRLLGTDHEERADAGDATGRARAEGDDAP